MTWPRSAVVVIMQLPGCRPSRAHETSPCLMFRLEALLLAKSGVS